MIIGGRKKLFYTLTKKSYQKAYLKNSVYLCTIIIINSVNISKHKTSSRSYQI